MLFGAESVAGAAGYASAHRLAVLPRVRVLDCVVPMAISRRSRLLGLAFLGRDRAGPGLLIPDCRSVHTLGMKFELELDFLGEDGEVLRSVSPARRCRFYRLRGAVAVLERPHRPTHDRPDKVRPTNGQIS